MADDNVSLETRYALIGWAVGSDLSRSIPKSDRTPNQTEPQIRQNPQIAGLPRLGKISDCFGNDEFIETGGLLLGVLDRPQIPYRNKIIFLTRIKEEGDFDGKKIIWIILVYVFNTISSKEKPNLCKLIVYNVTIFLWNTLRIHFLRTNGHF